MNHQHDSQKRKNKFSLLACMHMASLLSSVNALILNNASCSSCSYMCRNSAARFVVLSCERRGDIIHGSLAASLLGPPTRFEASKLKVVFMGEEIEKQQHPYTIPRAYTITHCDFTANLTLAVSNKITVIDKLRDWQSTLQRDDVVAEWKKIKEEMCLNVHCYVSGANLLLDLVAGIRYLVFSKELPLVLKAVVHGDSVLFSDHPELLDAKVWVYFHSRSRKYNRVECWGPLKDATQRKFQSRPEDFKNGAVDAMSRLISPKTIFQTLVAFLL